MKILYLSQERGIELEDSHEIMYLDHTSKVDNEFPDEVYKSIKEFEPELVLEREFNNGLAKYPDIISFVNKNFPDCKKAIWLIDSHCNLDWHLNYAPLFDYAFIAISRYQPIIASRLKEIGSNTKCFWLPLCYPNRRDRIIRNRSRVPFDIVFVGRWGRWFSDRTRLIELLQEQYEDKFLAITDYSNMETYIRQGIISFNRSVADDMNFRVFETLANGVELVTNDVQDLYLIKSLQERINIYKTDQDLLDLCDYILAEKIEHDVIKTQIWVQNHHCLIHRHNEILEMIKTGVQHEY